MNELDQRLRNEILAEPIETSALDSRIRARIATHRGHAPARWLVAIAAALLIAILALHTPRVYADAAEDHRREVIGRQHRAWLLGQAEIESLAERQGIPAPVVSSVAPAGYRIECGKVCRLGGRAFLHLVYSDGSRPFSVFLRPRDNSITAPAETAIGREHVALIQSPRLTGFIVTDQSREAALNLARLSANAL